MTPPTPPNRLHTSLVNLRREDGGAYDHDEEEEKLMVVLLILAVPMQVVVVLVLVLVLVLVVLDERTRTRFSLLHAPLLFFSVFSLFPMKWHW